MLTGWVNVQVTLTGVAYCCTGLLQPAVSDGGHYLTVPS